MIKENHLPKVRGYISRTGTGNLAVWANGFGLQTHTNEIDVRRNELLRFLGFKPTWFNAELINDFLPDAIKSDVLLGKISIKAIIKIAGTEYAKNGTRVDTNLRLHTPPS